MWYIFPLHTLKFSPHQRNSDKRLFFNYAKIQFLSDRIYSGAKKAIWHWQFGKISVLVNFITQKLKRILGRFRNYQ